MKSIVLSIFLFFLVISGCREKSTDIRSLEDLKGGRTFAVPTGTAADQFVLKRFPDAQIVYYNTVYDCALAVGNDKADAAVYDKPVLKNIAAKNQGLAVIDEVLFSDTFGFAVAMENLELKNAIDETLHELKTSGVYDDMMKRWIPDHGLPAPMPLFDNEGREGVLVFGTAAVTEPMSFVHGEEGIVGFDIEFAEYIARHLNKKLEIVNLEFGAMLPALISGKVDMIGAGLSITEERAKSVLFSESYFEGGIAALVKSSVAAEPRGTESQHEWNKLGVLMGSVHETYAIKTYPDAEILSYNTFTDLLSAMGGNKIDAAFMPNSVLNEVLSANPDFIVLEKDVFAADIAAGFREGEVALPGQFNEFLAEIRSNGMYDEVMERWIEQMATSLPDIGAENASGTLRIGVSSDIGLPVTSKVEGRLIGFDVELAARFAAWANKTPEFVDMPFGSLIPSLASGKIDMILAFVTITEERDKAIDFSDPYYYSAVSIIGKRSPASASAGESQGGGPPGNTFLQKLGQSFHNNIILEKRYLMILRGLWITIVITLLSTILGTILGGGVCAMRMSKARIWRNVARVYISLLRGTPVLVLLMIIYYVVFARVNLNAVLVAVIAFGLNFAAYVSEVFRAGIQTVDKGQLEAGIATGFSRVQTFIYITVPQALRSVLPVYKGEFISMMKMTSIVGYIAVEDLTKASDIIRSRTFDAFFPLIMAAVIYLCLAYSLTYVLDRTEFRLDPRNRNARVRKEAAL